MSSHDRPPPALMLWLELEGSWIDSKIGMPSSSTGFLKLWTHPEIWFQVQTPQPGFSSSICFYLLAFFLITSYLLRPIRNTIPHWCKALPCYSTTSCDKGLYTTGRPCPLGEARWSTEVPSQVGNQFLISFLPITCVSQQEVMKVGGMRCQLQRSPRTPVAGSQSRTSTVYTTLWMWFRSLTPIATLICTPAFRPQPQEAGIKYSVALGTSAYVHRCYYLYREVVQAVRGCDPQFSSTLNEFPRLCPAVAL